MSQGSPPALSRSNSTISIDYDPILDEMLEDEMEFAAPSFFDLLDSISNFGPRIESINRHVLKRSKSIRDSVVLKRVEPLQGKVNKEFDRAKARFTKQLDRAQQRWNAPKAASMREKLAFVLGVGNVFVTAFLMGGYPEYVHISYTLQILFWMPWRYFTYHKRGMHYFIADLCYYVNFLTLIFLWVAPWSEHLMAACYYLAFGSLAWAIIAWRNSLVFHSVDKVTSLFIHIFPPAVMHTIVHVCPRSYTNVTFPAINRIFDLSYGSAILSSSVAYVIWQTLYYVFIQVRRQEKIKAGRPTSFTWLLKSYSKTWIGKQVLRLPEALQPFAFMGIQFAYALVTMIPCPLWLHYRLAAAFFLSSVFSWSIWNGANYYARISAARDSFKEELENLRSDIRNMEAHGNSSPATPALAPKDQFISELDLSKLNDEETSANTAGNTARYAGNHHQ
ncbi:Putative uncharacterized protein [Taphrina deformans PYCC 5710]|uniref:Glycerophosphocholine acyltransferase 1 n=1 Tax=Taphrina deformans (strain PYCC 5710 / ATCC 11124 / CBS 356.35 / IMI 108563 / JCM 9778 / NBRC 8474) TaxID=1097556 RepID=R4X8S8_TAPDE|nr:Putative uncharacterized protein [Taphrina deformans PYCC 5710]|eukprot:CCG81815.1 Putative uncharacterized protein [Taphrina deformans PYCC 5710]